MQDQQQQQQQQASAAHAQSMFAQVQQANAAAAAAAYSFSAMGMNPATAGLPAAAPPPGASFPWNLYFPGYGQLPIAPTGVSTMPELATTSTTQMTSQQTPQQPQIDLHFTLPQNGTNPLDPSLSMFPFGIPEGIPQFSDPLNPVLMPPPMTTAPPLPIASTPANTKKIIGPSSHQTPAITPKPPIAPPHFSFPPSSAATPSPTMISPMQHSLTPVQQQGRGVPMSVPARSTPFPPSTAPNPAFSVRGAAKKPGTGRGRGRPPNNPRRNVKKDLIEKTKSILKEFAELERRDELNEQAKLRQLAERLCMEDEIEVTID
ncbi:hypothetical protein HK102_012906 [Quaeritorhiza haematococci]|nr:hypothetical protein HK102_012906 [Quaeritorhiza haematococci]